MSELSNLVQWHADTDSTAAIRIHLPTRICLSMGVAARWEQREPAWENFGASMLLRPVCCAVPVASAVGPAKRHGHGCGVSSAAARRAGVRCSFHVDPFFVRSLVFTKIEI